MKQLLLLLWLLILFSGIVFLFWQEEIKYNLPTPIPTSYRSVELGTKIDLPQITEVRDKNPLFLHFFNPSCPCSRFNVLHVSSLIKKYDGEISFAIVVLSGDTKYTTEEIQDKFDAKVPVYFDSTIAAACGVYSTPQAVLLGEQRQLYYRGNYNKSRYCIDKNTNYAQMAIDSFLTHSVKPVFSPTALKSYGCELPICRK